MVSHLGGQRNSSNVVRNVVRERHARGLTAEISFLPFVFIGAGCRSRTRDLLITNQCLISLAAAMQAVGSRPIDGGETGHNIGRQDGELMGGEPVHMIAIRTIELSAKVRHRSGAGFPYKQPRAQIKSHKLLIYLARPRGFEPLFSP